MSCMVFCTNSQNLSGHFIEAWEVSGGRKGTAICFGVRDGRHRWIGGEENPLVAAAVLSIKTIRDVAASRAESLQSTCSSCTALFYFSCKFCGSFHCWPMLRNEPPFILSLLL